MITYNNIIEKIQTFVDNHFFLQAFEYGYELEEADLEKFERYPILFANYTGSDYDEGSKSYSFEFLVFDVPTDKDSKELRIREVISDSEQCLEDLLADIRNGFNVFLFDEDYEVENATIAPVAMEGSNVYSGAVLTCDIIVGYKWDSCEAPLTGVTPPPSGDCAAATYQNSDGTFTQEIASGSVFTSLDITITQADGSTTTEPTNKDVTCEFPQLTLQNSTPQNIGLVTEYPAGGNVAVIDTPVANSDASYSVNTPSGVLLSLPDINVTDVRGNTTQVPSVQDVVCSFIRIDLQNSLETVLYSITSYPSGGKFTLTNLTFDILNQNGTTLQTVSPVVGVDVSLNDTVITDSDLDTYNTETALAISLPNTTVNSVSTSGGVMTINTPSAATPSGIAYKATSPLSSYTTRTGDCYDRFISGEYAMTSPVYPVSYASLDYDAQQSQVRGTPATGTSSTDIVAPTILNADNAFGNRYRYTDDAGNPSDASVGSNLWAHVDWNNHSWTGATTGYVIDHLYGYGLNVSYYLDGSIYSLASADANGQDWNAWIDHIDGLGTYLGYTGWRPLDLPYAMNSAHGAKVEPDAVWADEFFNSQRTDNRCGMMTGEVSDTTKYIFLRDSSNAEMTLVDNQSGGDLGFQSDIVNVFLVRNHY